MAAISKKIHELDKKMKKFSLVPKPEKNKKKIPGLPIIKHGAEMHEEPFANKPDEILVKLSENPRGLLTPKLLIPGYEDDAKGWAL